MSRSRILIIDSDSRLVQSVREYLLRFGFEVNALPEFKDTRFLRDVNNPHLVVVDTLAAAQAIRGDSSVPIIITRPGDVNERIQGLELGADDYITKPYEPRELVARINTILRRAPAREAMHSSDVEPREWRFKGLVVQSTRRKIILDNEPVELTTAEFDLLRMLVNNAQQTLSREQILDQLRGIEWEAVDRSVDILVSRLRDKLRDDPRKPRFIRTVRSVGYQFVGESDTQSSQQQAG